jgi:hypothetical protein
MQKAKGEEAESYFRFKVKNNILFILAFFLNVGLVIPIQFGLVQSVSNFENRN